MIDAQEGSPSGASHASSLFARTKADRAGRIPHDAEMYKWRHLVENFFCQLKAFRRIATRYEKTDACFAGLLNLVAACLAVTWGSLGSERS